MVLDAIEELFSPLFTTEWGRRLGKSLMILFWIVCLFTVMHIIFSWRELSAMRHSQQKQTVAVTDSMAQLIATLPEQHLFGQAQVTSLPITQLQIHLKGVMNAVPQKFSHVIISEGDQPAKVYQIGDILPSSGVRIRNITSEGVVLENGKQLENLPLQRIPMEFQGMPAPLPGEK